MTIHSVNLQKHKKKKTLYFKKLINEQVDLNEQKKSTIPSTFDYFFQRNVRIISLHNYICKKNVSEAV